jgi:hypothetical protein
MRVAFFFLSFSFIIGAIGFAYFDLQRNGKSPAAFETAPVVEGVATETPAKTLLPVLNENRSLALSFRPVKKPYALDLSISSAHAAVILDADSGTIWTK